MDESLTIGRLAALADVNVETVRYYQRRGLLREPARCRGQARRYGGPDIQRLRFIRRAQAMGFALREIDELLRLRSGNVCPTTRSLVADRLSAIERQIAALASHRDELRRWITNCDANSDATSCPDLARLGADGNPQRRPRGSTG